ncbi:MAG: hypothetical protein AAFX40_15035 [Cyanobacteria bacterium J06639_1]
MDECAQKSSWQTLAPPELREPLGYEHTFTSADAARLKLGLIPQAMEDKWFVYFEDGWLYLHRSWTGALIYWLRVEDCPAGIRVVESWVSRGSKHYRETDTAYDSLMLDFLLRRMMLGQDVAFPIRSAANSNPPPGLYQHHAIGRSYPERTVLNDEPSSEENR